MKTLLAIVTTLFLQSSTAYANSIDIFLSVIPEGSYQGRDNGPCEVSVLTKEGHLEITVTSSDNVTKTQKLFGNEEIYSTPGIPFQFEDRSSGTWKKVRTVHAGPCYSTPSCGVIYVSDLNIGAPRPRSTVSCIVKY